MERPMLTMSRSKAIKTLEKWLIGEHNLEVETGRFVRNRRRDQRICERCWKEKHVKKVGDEMHALTICIRAWEARQSAELQVIDWCEQENVDTGSSGYLYERIPHFNKLSTPRRNAAWRL